MTHRNGIDGDGRFRPYAFGRAKGTVHQTIQNNAGRVFLQCLTIGIFHLPENLRLTHDHRIKTRCHTENMAHGVFTSIFVKTSGSFGLSQSAISSQKVTQFFYRKAVFCNTGNNLHAVTGGKIQNLLYAVDGHKSGKQILFLLTAGKYFFPDSDGRCFMI